MHVYIYIDIYIVSGPNHFIFWNPFSKVDWPEKAYKKGSKKFFQTNKLAASQSLSKQRAGAQRSSVPDREHKAQAGSVEKRFAFSW